jgi:UDP-glucose 4-epimerase
VVVLVTGAAGFLGRHICERLLADGDEVVPAGRPDIELPSPAFDELLKRRPPDAVVHCATPASVPASVERPHEDFERSVKVQEGLLGRLSAQRRPPRVAFISSAAVYGEPIRLPVNEDDEPRPVSPYGHHRLMCERLLTEYTALGGVPTVSLRVFSAYGEGLRRQVLWDICRQALESGKVVLAGTGDETRDFIHARDVASAVALALRTAEGESRTFNVASGEATTIRLLAQSLARELGLREDAVSFSGETRPGDPRHWKADVGRIRGLGWEPAVPLAAGLAAYAAWARSASYPATSWSR